MQRHQCLSPLRLKCKAHASRAAIYTKDAGRSKTPFLEVISQTQLKTYADILYIMHELQMQHTGEV